MRGTPQLFGGGSTGHVPERPDGARSRSRKERKVREPVPHPPTRSWYPTDVVHDPHSMAGLIGLLVNRNNNHLGGCRRVVPGLSSRLAVRRIWTKHSPVEAHLV